MSQTERAHFQCSGCGKSYAWKTELAGRKVKCKCGTVMIVPQTLERPPEDSAADLYDLVPEEPPPSARPQVVAPVEQVARQCPACQTALRPGAVLCVACGFNLQTGKKTGATIPPAHSPTPAARAGGLPAGIAIPPRMGPKQMQKNAVAYDEQSRRKMIMLGLGGLLLVGLLVGGVVVMKNASPSEQLSEYDRKVQSDLSDGRAISIDEWMEYPRLQLAGGHDKKKARALADSMLQAGATDVLLPQSPGSMWLVAVLPPEPEKRQAVFDFINKYHTNADPNARKLLDDGRQKYVQLRFHIFST